MRPFAPARLPIRAIPVLALLALLAAGCEEPRMTRYFPRSFEAVTPYQKLQGDPAMLVTIRSIAVMPFENQSGVESLDTRKLADQIAGQLSARGVLNVVYPERLMRLAAEENRAVRAHNANLKKLHLLGKSPSSDRAQQRREGTGGERGEENVPRQMLDPAGSLADAVRLARQLGVDAVLVGAVTDYDPYYRPRIGLDLRLVPTGRTDSAARALSELTQWGVPKSLQVRHHPAWHRQQMYDTRDGGVSRKIYLYARRRHTEHSSFDTELYLRSSERFFEFLGYDIATAFLDARMAAYAAAEEAAEARAEAEKMKKEAARNRLRALAGPTPPMPSGIDVVEKNTVDNRSTRWRRDVYSRQHPERTTLTEPEPVRGAVRLPGGSAGGK
jgi:hypothetical protein